MLPPMPEAPRSCRDVCWAEGEPLAGSAGAATDWIGIAWPKPRWDADSALASEGLPISLHEIEAAAKARGRKLSVRVFQRHAQPRTEHTELVMWGRGAGVRLADVPLADAAGRILRYLDGEPLPEAEPIENEIFVCTDGKHDPCCARLGKPLYDALRAEIQASGSSARIAECSHLGGHRFAANLVTLPAGVLYGRVEPGDAKALLAAVQRGEVLAARFRGRIGQDELMQVAEHATRERLGWRAQLEITDVREGADEARVELRLADSRRVRVRCERRSYRGPASCGPDEPSVEQLRWIRVEISEA
jgi:hypothetical protein